MKLTMALLTPTCLTVLIIYNLYVYGRIGQPDALVQWTSEGARQLVITNLVVLMALLVAIFAAVTLQQRSAIRKTRIAKEELELRQFELEDSKRVLYSLMEDLSQERNAAHALSSQLQQANNVMALRNNEMEQFIHTVSHDLRSPLVSIAGYCELLKSELDGVAGAEATAKLERVSRNAGHMEALLNELLDISRIIQQDMKKSETDTDKVVGDQLAILEDLITQSDAEVEVSRPSHKVYANERLLAQCLNNLLTNALKYRDAERALKIEIATEQTLEQTAIVVRDTGIGIDSQYHDQIFHIFERLDHGEGTGVGLAIVKAIMEKHGGTVSLQSTIGKGSRFRLVFPTQQTFGD